MTNPDQHLPSRPTRHNSIIRFLVWSAVVGTIVPVLLITWINSQIILSFAGLRDSDSGFVPTVRTLMPGQSPVSDNRETQANQLKRLRSLTARPEMIAGTASRLSILAIAFDGAKPEPTQPGSPVKGHAVDPDGYRRLTLDLSGLPNDAVVLIADQAVRWVVSGVGGSWGRIGFEGQAPFDVSGGRPNMLAGFRIGAFGTRATARAADPGSFDPNARREWCASVRLWAEQFAVPMGQVEFGVVMNPTAIRARNGNVASDGAWGIVRGGSGILAFCKPWMR